MHDANRIAIQLAFFICGIVGFNLIAGGAAAAPALRAAQIHSEFDRSLGDPNAPVTLIEYGSPGCPICARFNAEVIPQLKRTYIDTGKVYYVFRMFPLWPTDLDAEKLARCFPAERYLSFLDTLFRAQPRWAPDYHVTDIRGGLLHVAETAGMREDQANKCMDDHTLDGRINSVAKEAESKYHVHGTPTLVVDGVAQPTGAVSFEALSKLLDDDLSKSPAGTYNAHSQR